MANILVPSGGRDSWRAFLAKPDLHWATGFSARTDPIFPEYSLLHRCRAVEEMYGDHHEVIAAVLETESAA